MSKAIYTSRSTTIHKADYNPQERYLDLEFRSGNVYRYYDVPPRLWKVFELYIECDGSPGSFFNEYIKGQYAAEKIKDVNLNHDFEDLKIR